MEPSGFNIATRSGYLCGCFNSIVRQGCLQRHAWTAYIATMRKRNTSLARRVRVSSNRILRSIANRHDCPYMKHVGNTWKRVSPYLAPTDLTVGPWSSSNIEYNFSLKFNINEQNWENSKERRRRQLLRLSYYCMEETYEICGLYEVNANLLK